MKQPGTAFFIFSGILCSAQAQIIYPEYGSDTIRRGIHSRQSELYSAYPFTSEKQWDSLAVAANGPVPAPEGAALQAGCTLHKRVFGWNPYWAGSAYSNYRWDLLSDLCHFSYEVNPNDGSASTTHNWLTDAAVTQAKNNGVKIHLCATLFSNHATFLTSASAKSNFISTIISQIQQRGGNGVNIDFESVPSSQSANFTQFMTDLCSQVHAADSLYEVSIALPAVDWNAVYDVNALKGYVDLFIIMGYDYYWSGSTTAGPSDPLYNFDPGYNYTHTKSITYYLNKNVPGNKLLLGVPYYGMEWPTSADTVRSAATAQGISRTYTYIRNNSSGNYSAPKWEPNSYSQYFTYNNGAWNQCFINSGYSLRKRFDAVNQFGIGGIGIWALGYDNGYTDYWNAIQQKFSDCGPVPCSDTLFDMGGPNRNYYNNESYTYTIAPPGASALSLSFSAFNTQAGNDFLSLYDGPGIASPPIGTYSGNNSPGTISSTGPFLTLKWVSNSGTVAGGWSAIWNCLHATSISETPDEDLQFSLQPDPFHESATLYFRHPSKSTGDFTIYTLWGKAVKTQVIRPGTENMTIERGDLVNGLYFLTLRSAAMEKTIKFVVK